MSDFSRRLPVYLLIDCSGSMVGEPIEAVRQGIKMLLSELRGDPRALQTAYLSIITFDSHARQITPLTELMEAREPALSACGSTSLGLALKVLMQCVDREVQKTGGNRKADWRPLVFILTDGAPTDGEAFREAAEKIKSMKTSAIVACAAGSKAKTSELKKITDNVLVMNTLSSGDMSRFFEWVSSTVKITSGSIGNKKGSDLLPPPPHGFVIVP